MTITIAQITFIFFSKRLKKYPKVNIKNIIILLQNISCQFNFFGFNKIISLENKYPCIIE